MTDSYLERQPPYSEEAEESVLAAMFLDEQAIYKAFEIVDDTSFYRPGNRRIFRAAVSLAERGSVVDALTIATELQNRGELNESGGKEYLGYLVGRVPTSANVEHHARIVAEMHDRRTIIAACTQAVGEAYSGTVPAKGLVQALTAELLPVAADVSRGGFHRLKDILWPLLEELERRAHAFKKGESAGLSSGLLSLDRKLAGGFQPGELVIVAAVPGHGKTALALNIAINAAKAGNAVGFVSAEMDRMALVERIVNNASSVDGMHTRSGDLSDGDFARLATGAGPLADLPLWIDDTALPTLDDIGAKVRVLKAEQPKLSLVFVDFIQLIQADYKGRNEMETVMLERIAYGLKGIAKTLGLVVVATCQPNDKEIEDRQDKAPQLKDLARSAGFRRAADFIALCHRPKLYNPTAVLDTLELNMAKTRQGVPPFTTSLRWEGRYMRVTDMNL